MARDRFYLLISGFISLSLFLIFLLLFSYAVFSASSNKIFAFKKKNYIAISLNNIPVKKKNNIMKTPVIKKEAVVPVKTEKKQPIQASPDVDVDDLFSDVWTKDISVKKEKKIKKTDNKRFQKIQKRIKTAQKNSVPNTVNTFENVKINKTQDSSGANEVNEYFAKIQALVYDYFNPPQNSQGYSVRAVIELSALGKFIDFRILNYSANVALNEECDKIKDRLMGVLFPVNPENKSGNYIVILTSKE